MVRPGDQDDVGLHLVRLTTETSWCKDSGDMAFLPCAWASGLGSSDHHASFGETLPSAMHAFVGLVTCD